MSRQSISVSRQSLPLGRVLVSRHNIFFITIECGQIGRFCVAIKKFYVAT